MVYECTLDRSLNGAIGQEATAAGNRGFVNIVGAASAAISSRYFGTDFSEPFRDYHVSTYGRFLPVRGTVGGRLLSPRTTHARVSAGSMTYLAPELIARADS